MIERSIEVRRDGSPKRRHARKGPKARAREAKEAAKAKLLTVDEPPIEIDQEGVFKHAQHTLHKVMEKEMAIIHSVDETLHHALDAVVHKEQEIMHSVGEMLHLVPHKAEAR